MTSSCAFSVRLDLRSADIRIFTHASWLSVPEVRISSRLAMWLSTSWSEQSSYADLSIFASFCARSHWSGVPELASIAADMFSIC